MFLSLLIVSLFLFSGISAAIISGQDTGTSTSSSTSEMNTIAIPASPAQTLPNNYSNNASISKSSLTDKLLIPGETLPTSMGIDPCSLYSNEPAPMGLADYGVINPGLFETTYAYNTTSFLGGANISSLSTYNSTNATVNHEMTFQLNLNLAFRNGKNLFVYWVQDVAFINTSTHQIQFIDNVWNMSSQSSNMHNSTIAGNGTIGNSSGTYFYYSCANPNLRGNLINLNYPSSVQFMMNSTVKNGMPEVNFMYNDGFGWVTYDNAIFSFATNLSEDLGFVVDGKITEPDNYSLYDAELILGGPGGGTSTTDLQSNVNLTLQYWNGHNYQEISNAFNFGSDTAETIGNVISKPYYTTYTGNLFEEVTAGSDGSLKQVYTSSNISLLNISTPLPSGTLYVNGSAHPFVGKDVNLTLGPGSYKLEIYSNSTLYSSINVNLTSGEYLPLEITDSKILDYTVMFSESGLTSGTTWYVNLSDGQTFKSSTSTISFSEPDGRYSYTIATTDKTYSAPEGSFTVNGMSVSERVTFSKVRYNVTFIESGLPAGTIWYANGTGGLSNHIPAPGNVTFTLTNGTYTFSVTNLSIYYTENSAFIVTVNGKNITETLDYQHWAYITGTVPSNATITINGYTITASSGKFNISVPAGKYVLTATLSGYDKYYNNFTLNPGVVKNISITLTPVSRASTTSPLGIYIIIGALIAVVVIGSIIAVVKRR